MCAIVDANVAPEVFGHDRPAAGSEFFKWINREGGRLVAGGRLLEELERTVAREWVRQAMIAGRIRAEDNSEVDARAAELRDSCISDDPHVIALAQVSGARLLYSNDQDLHRDFRNKRLIDGPRGSVYSTRDDKGFRDRHRRLLRRKNLCRSGR